MTHRVSTAIGGMTQIHDNKNTWRRHVSSPSRCPIHVVNLYYNAGMGIYHMVVPHAEFVLQDATPWTFAIMTKTLTKLLCEQVSNFHFPVFSVHDNWCSFYTRLNFQFSQFLYRIQNFHNRPVHTDCRATRAAAVLAQGIFVVQSDQLSVRIPFSGKHIHS